MALIQRASVQQPDGTGTSTQRPAAREAQSALDRLFEKAERPKPVHLISTGGTIEGRWNWDTDCVALGKESVLPGYVQGLKPHVDFRFDTVCLKDSREINERDRREIRRVVAESPCDQILIAHGCFGIPDLAEYIVDGLPKGHGKTVVLFGAKAPLAEFVMSDGSFNLGFSTAAVLVLEPGVYIGMDGRIFNAGEVNVDTTKRFSDGQPLPAEEAQRRLNEIFARLNKPETIHLMRTGGTIESKWDPKLDTAVVDVDPLLPTYLERIRLQLTFEFTTICEKDSREVNYRDRKRLVEQIVASSHRRILVPHGTYTMPDTAQFLNESLPEGHDKVVVLFGSMIPLNGFIPSDAPFNIGFATAASLVSRPGVYLGMNARLFDAEQVQKNRSEGRFEEDK